MKRLARIIILIGTVMMLLSCADESVSAPTTTTRLSRDREFIDRMVDLYPSSTMTGLEMLRLAYDYCTDLVEGATLADLHSRLDLLGSPNEAEIHRSIINISIDTICSLDI